MDDRAPKDKYMLKLKIWTTCSNKIYSPRTWLQQNAFTMDKYLSWAEWIISHRLLLRLFSKWRNQF